MMASNKYKINPDFVEPEPTGAKFFSYLAPEENTWEARQEKCRLLAEGGARFFRLTLVSDEHPHPPYPHGIWIEGWADPYAVPIPFGTAEKPGGPVYPPLTRPRETPNA